MKKYLNFWHTRIAWSAAIAAILWGLSGLAHPIIVWFGPQPATRAAPQATIDLSGAQALGAILDRAGIAHIVEARAVDENGAAVWLVRAEPSSPRRAFDPWTGVEIIGLDQARAERLARHYLALPDTPIADVTYQTEFDNAYPSVNRLLPVWRIRFERPDGLTIYVDSAGARLSSVTDDRKTALQSFFRAVHTWSFLPDGNPARIALMSLLLVSLLAATILGLALLIAIRRKNRMQDARAWHRTLGYLVAIPALMLVASGFWRLLASVGESETAAVMQPIAAERLWFDLGLHWSHVSEGRAVASLAVLDSGDAEPLYRLALAEGAVTKPASEHDHHNHAAASPSLQEHFKGLPQTGPALTAQGPEGNPVEGGDQAVALQLAARLVDLPREAIADISLVTRFTDEYGFANKRLPVWRIAYDTPARDIVFIDTGDAVVASRIDSASLRADWVFSTFHKWRFLDPLTPPVRDGLLVLSVFGILAMTGVGLALQVKRRKAPKRLAPVANPAPGD